MYVCIIHFSCTFVFGFKNVVTQYWREIIIINIVECGRPHPFSNYHHCSVHYLYCDWSSLSWPETMSSSLED